jgi:hypothetical protein
MMDTTRKEPETLDMTEHPDTDAACRRGQGPTIAAMSPNDTHGPR